MRSLVLLAASLFSIFGMSDTYSGEGSYKTNEGEEGEYSLELDMNCDGDTVTINQSLNFEDEVLNVSVTLQKIDDTFYNVLDNETGDVIGSGYCWVMEGEDRICHSYSKKDGYVVELTIKTHGDYLYRVGSRTDMSSGYKVIWKDESQKYYKN